MKVETSPHVDHPLCPCADCERAFAKTQARRCLWCTEWFVPKRPHQLCCCKSCRQAKSRFGVAFAGGDAAEPMRFCYADPPYIGKSKRYYGKAEVDHAKLVLRLTREFPNGWALSASSESLQEVLALIPSALEPRVCPWIRGCRPAVSYRALDAWEPVVVVGGRQIKRGPKERLENVLVGRGGRQHSHPGALVGMKSATFCEWMFRQLGALRGDELVDMFPGSGIVTRAWREYTRKGTK